MRRLVWLILLCSAVPVLSETAAPREVFAFSAPAAQDASALTKIEKILSEVRVSYPELRDARISLKLFTSKSDFFRSQFSISRFFTFRRFQYIIFVNEQVFNLNAPEDGIRAIVAHELAHVAYFKRHTRLGLFRLIGLASRSYTARFERGADLQAIKRGFGEGLKSYREWLYQNIPAENVAEKKRNYFSPAEIDLILALSRAQPGLIDALIKKVPRDRSQIEMAISGLTIK